jgi:hypothetical protein
VESAVRVDAIMLGSIAWQPPGRGDASPFSFSLYAIRTSLAPQLVRRPAAVADLLRVSWVHRIAGRDRIGGWRSDDYKATTAVMLEAPESARRTDSYVQQTTHKWQKYMRESTLSNIYGVDRHFILKFYVTMLR